MSDPIEDKPPKWIIFPVQQPIGDSGKPVLMGSDAELLDFIDKLPDADAAPCHLWGWTPQSGDVECKYERGHEGPCSFQIRRPS